jgi:gluconokinase
MTADLSHLPPPGVIVLAGVTGSGKSTVGASLAARLGARFLDADTLHTPDSLQKMRAGIPLDDHDRGPWLGRIAAEIKDALEHRALLVLACSALKRAYRKRMDPAGDGRVIWVFLEVEPQEIASRLQHRHGHFMNPALLQSQLDTFEPPGTGEIALIVRAQASPDDVVRNIETALSKPGGIGSSQTYHGR